MRVARTVVAVLWLAVVTGRGEESPDRCCPSRFTVDPDPPEYHFRCEVANLTDGCDNVTMTEFVANTAIDTDGETVCIDKSFVMTDWNWLDLEPFQPNVACAYYLPPVEGCCWDVWLVKNLDPIVCGDNCQCDCEDNVHFEEGDLSTKTYCDSDGGTPQAGWCWPPVGPHNVYGTVPFFTAANTSLLTTFRSDNINGVGSGALAFTYAVPCGLKRSVSQLQPLSVWAPSEKLAETCQKEFTLCNDKRCDMSRECQDYIKIVQYVTRTLHEIFNDGTGLTAEKTYTSKYSVLSKAARHAKRNIEKYGRPVPKINQLRKKLEKEPIAPSPRQTTGHRTTHPSPSRTTLLKITRDPTIKQPGGRTQKDSIMPSATHSTEQSTTHPSPSPMILPTITQDSTITNPKDTVMPSASHTRGHRTRHPSPRPTKLPKKIALGRTITQPPGHITKDPAMPSASHTRGHRTRHPSLRPTKLPKKVAQDETITSPRTSAQKDSTMPSASYTVGYRTTEPTARPTTLPKITQGSGTEQ